MSNQNCRKKPKHLETAFLAVAFVLMSWPAAAADSVRIVQFWASWCFSCAGLMTQTDALSARYAARLDLISIDTTLDAYERAVEKIPAKVRTSATLSWDDDRALAEHWRIVTVPTILVLDGDGEVQYRHVGHLLADDALALEQVLARLADQ